MRPDPTYKDIFGHAFMVEELMRWLVAELHGAHELVDALDFSRLLRVHEQSVSSGARRNLSTTLRHWRLRFTEQSLLLWMWMWQVG